MIYIILVVVFMLAFANGANDNFKGVATLFGTKTTDYKKSLGWATITTFLGSVTSVFLAESLVKNFSGKGLIPDEFISSPVFATSVALGAMLTVLLATKIGMPVSTTHAIVGALTGTGIIVAGGAFNLGKLGSTFFLPLLVSPLLAAAMSLMVYLIFHYFRKRSGITKESCLCVGEEQKVIALAKSHSDLTISSVKGAAIKTGTVQQCEERYNGNMLGVSAQTILNGSHFISAGVVSFARGLNDTPKIAGLLLLAPALGLNTGVFLLGVLMALGGILNAKKVGETMSKKITTMNHGQGFTANLITSLLVTTASVHGMPVSTTHVSVGSLFGIGTVTGKANKKVIAEILLSWLLTLPVAAIMSMASYLILSQS